LIKKTKKALVNLVNNAIKFTSTGSVVVRVTPHADSTGEQVSVRMSVTDTGIGIPQDRLDRLFKPFSQVDASTTRKFGGTGLGLAISKQLVELMGGAIGVESEANRGSTFWFTIKVQRQPHAAAEAADRPSVDASGLRVLAVDDSQTTRAILEEQLLSWGLRVETCGSAAEAIATLRRAAEAGQPFDVAIIDSDMTPTGGFELARTIRNDSGLGKTVLMAMLPMEAATQTAQLKQAGFAGHLTKPVRQSQLFDGIMRAVARDHASQLRGASAPAAAEASLAPAQQKRAGRILVAEDNEVNQIVARELLEKAGYRCEIVENGRKAVVAALGGRFDLVLMDSQMPEMDGFEATKIIRQREAERGAAAGGAARIPIIALTANAIKGDREACLEVGMNAYCTKPIDSKQLLSLIDSFVGNRESRAPAATGAQAPTDVEPARGPESQIPAILVDTLLERCMNSLDTVNVVIGKFETQARRDVEQIQQSLSGHDLKTAARSAHALKGTAAIVAADRLWKIAGELERLGRAEQADDMQRQLEQLRAEVDRCIGYLPSVRSLAAERLSAAVQTV
jgi:Amt family ammonium transporter